MFNKKKIFFWSPMLSHVGTINAVEKSAESLRKYLNYEIYLINVFNTSGITNDISLTKDFYQVFII